MPASRRLAPLALVLCALACEPQPASPPEDDAVSADAVTGPGRLQVSPAAFDLGDMFTLGIHKTTIQLHNKGAEPLPLIAMDPLEGALVPWIRLVPRAPVTIAPGGTLDLTVKADFHAFVQGEIARIRIVVDHPDVGEVVVPVKGRALKLPAFTPAVLDFGKVMEGESKTLKVTVENPLDTLLAIDSGKLLGSSAYALVPPLWGPLKTPPEPAVLAPGASHTVTIRFAPGAVAGNEVAGLHVVTTTPVSGHVLQIIGTAWPKPWCKPVLGRPIVFGPVKAGGSATALVKVFNKGGRPCTYDRSFLYGCVDTGPGTCVPLLGQHFAVVAPTTSLFPLQPGKSGGLTVRFDAPNPPLGTERAEFRGWIWARFKHADGIVDAGPILSDPPNLFATAAGP